jgi:hypothetical protein
MRGKIGKMKATLKVQSRAVALAHGNRILEQKPIH